MTRTVVAWAGAGERPSSGGSAPPDGAGGGRLALGMLVASAWEGLLAAGWAACPVCGGEMRREGQAGRCYRCRARLL